jgi:thiol-disulfide isomerase/thioredoxin
MRKGNKIFVLFVLCLFSVSNAIARNGFKVKLTIQNNTDTLIYLGNYYGKGGQIYKVDSARLTKGTATAVLKTDSTIAGGIYILLFSDKTGQVEVLVNNGDDIELNFDKTNPIKTAKFKNSPENIDFYIYQNYLMSISDEYNQIQSDLASAKTKEDTTRINERSARLSKKIDTYRDDYCVKKPKSMLAALFNAISEPIIPDYIKNQKDKRVLDSMSYVYYKAHYWDRFNFQDDRIIYTPIYDGKIKAYYNLVPQQADSTIKEINFIMNKAKGTKDVWRYSFWWQANYAGNSKVMGMDEAYVWMIENYVMRDLCPWLPDSTRKDYEKDYYRISPGLMGKASPEMELVDVYGAPAKLSTTVFNNDYTVIAFYAPTCHHCQEEIPDMDSTIREVLKKHKNIKVKIFGIENEKEDEKWKAMIAKDKLTSDIWIHVHDPEEKNIPLYRSAYNVVSNPTFYLLNNEGKIVGKRVDHTNIAGLFDFLEKKKKEGK